MNKTLTTTIAIAGIFIFSLIQLCSATLKPVVSIEPQHQKVFDGEAFTVNITVDPMGEEIFGMDYTLYFNKDLLNATSLTKGTFFGDADTMRYGGGINNTIGTIDYGEAIIGESGITTRGTLTTLTFETIKPGMSNLNFSDMILISNEEQLIPNVNNGTCEIEAIEHTPTPAPTLPSGSGDGGSSVTPTHTSALSPLPPRAENGNGGTPVTPAQTPTPMPAQAQDLTSTPSLSPSPSPYSASAITPSEENEKRLPGFDAAFTIIELLAISYLIFLLKRKGGSEKNE